ncbi:MAG TPA: penicillin-binding transpeptidase domain-containing protein [Clostridium sp.]
MFYIFIPKYDSRIKSTLILFITMLFLLTIRLTYLQVFPTEAVESQSQILQRENISDSKFMVLDTSGKDLITYKNKYIVVFDKKPFSLNNYEETLEGLMALNFIMKEEIASFNYNDVMKSNGKLYYEISENTYNKINTLKNIKGIYTYVYKEADKKEAWTVSSLLSSIPESGNLIEGSLEEQIYNSIANNKFPQSSFSLDTKAVYEKSPLEENEKNNNLKLTIDDNMTEKVREILKKDEFSSLSNVGVTIMESNTGKIRVMAQKDETQANINLSMEGSGYEPGSVFKLITLGAALDKGIVTLQDRFTCTGQICKTKIHGNITAEEALIESCNDVIAKIGNEVGYDSLMEYAEKAGLFNRVLNLQQEGKNEAIGQKPAKESGLNNISIGQCLTVTPLQITGATNSIINEGVYIKPYIIDEIVDSNNNTIKTFNSESRKVFSTTTSKLLKNAMDEVVEKGTGVKAKVDGIEIGGKTGSATGADGKTHGWFSGYFEVGDKLYTMTVFVPDINQGGKDLGGGDTAAPVFREIVKILNEK